MAMSPSVMQRGCLLVGNEKLMAQEERDLAVLKLEAVAQVLSTEGDALGDALVKLHTIEGILQQ